MIVNGVFWAPGMDRLLTTEQCRQLHPREINIKAMRTQGVPQLPQRLLAIADISCDLRVSCIPCTRTCMDTAIIVTHDFVVYDVATNRNVHVYIQTIGFIGVLEACDNH